MQRTYVIDQLINDRYKKLIARQLSDIKALKKEVGNKRADQVTLLIKKQREELYQCIVEDQQVFLKKESVVNFLDRHYYSSLFFK